MTGLLDHWRAALHRALEVHLAAQDLADPATLRDISRRIQAASTALQAANMRLSALNARASNPPTDTAHPASLRTRVGQASRELADARIRAAATQERLRECEQIIAQAQDGLQRAREQIAR